MGDTNYQNPKVDHYFYKQNRELIEEFREKLDHQRRLRTAEQEKAVHWMKCPKCGHDLHETDMGGVLVDLCGTCGGLFLDKGELELLKAAKDHTSFFKLMNEFVYRKSDK